MKICIIGPTHPYRGGIAHHTTLLVCQLREAGHEVLFVSFSRQYPKILYGRDDKDPSRNPLTAEAEYLIDSVNPLTWWQTLRRIRTFRPELVIMPWWVPFWAPVWGYLSWGIKRFASVPKLFFICHNVLPHEQSGLDTAALKFAIGRGDAYIVHAQGQADILRTIYPAALIEVTPLPTYESLHTDTQSTALNVPDDRPLILFCGLIRYYKGVDILLDALPAVLKQQLVHCAIVGEFWDNEEQYLDQIGRLNLTEHVTIVNKYVEDELLTAYVERADVVILPYRSATQSAVVQLAFGRQTPVITTTVGGLPDVVEDGRTGLLVPPEDPAALAEAIIDYFMHKRQAAFTQNIIASQQQFTWQKFVHLISEMYEA